MDERERHMPLKFSTWQSNMKIKFSTWHAVKQSRMHAAFAIFLPQSRIDGSSLRLCVLYDGVAYEPGPASAPAAEAPVESMVLRSYVGLGCKKWLFSRRAVESSESSRVAALGMTSFR